MKKIAIYGAGKCGEYIIREIQKNRKADIVVEVVIDNNIKKFLHQKREIPIVDLENFISIYSKNVDAVLVATVNSLVSQNMVISLLNRKYENIYVLPDNILDGQLPVLNDKGEFASYIKTFNCYKPILPYLEYHVSDRCNLNCKGCGHFSNLYNKNTFPKIEEFLNSLKYLSKKFKNIKIFRLLGGEPFVNPDLKMFIYNVKREFPYAEIKVATNGLLFPKIDSDTIKAIRETNTIVDISQYTPTRKIIEEIIEFSEKNSIEISVSPRVTKFQKNINLHKNEDFKTAFQNCSSNTCHFLRRNRIYPCPAICLLYENMDFFETNINNELLENNSFDLENEDEGGWDILRKLSCPSDLCKYCSTKVEYFEWDISNGTAKKEDWLVDSKV